MHLYFLFFLQCCAIELMKKTFTKQHARYPQQNFHKYKNEKKIFDLKRFD